MHSLDLESWYARVEARCLADRTFAEVRRSLQSLSASYVQRGGRERRATVGEGKRAAFALFYGTLHLATAAHVVDALGVAADPPRRVVDLGCGTGVAGAAWALACDPHPPLEGFDRSRWAAAEARWTWRALGLRGRAHAGDLAGWRARDGDGVVLGWAVNELDDGARAALLDRLLDPARRGPRLVLEPIARRVVPWWESWAEAFAGRGGRADTWRFPAELPERLRLLDRAAGLDHRELTARSLWLEA